MKSDCRDCSRSATAAASSRGLPARSGSAASSAVGRPRARRRSSPRRAAPGGSAGWSGSRDCERAEHVALAALLEVDPAELEAVGGARPPRRAARGPGEPASARGDQQAEPGRPPRPTRPRSWWSWETPNRSASRSTIMVALATSTPTSITVVETSTSISPAAKARIVRSFSSGGSRPCSTPTRSPASGPSASSAATLLDGAQRRAVGGRRRVAVLVEVELVGLALLRLVAGDPRAHDVGLVALADLLAHPLPDPVDPLRLLGERHDVGLDRRPAGGQLGRASRSRGRRRRSSRRCAGSASRSSPARAAGVPALSVSAARCSTPKRCCSSTTTRPRSANCDRAPRAGRGCRSTMPASPLAIREQRRRCAAALVIEPGEQRDRGAPRRRRRACRPRRGRRASR